jgi:hypothetical protein
MITIGKVSFVFIALILKFRLAVFFKRYFRVTEAGWNKYLASFEITYFFSSFE